MIQSMKTRLLYIAIVLLSVIVLDACKVGPKFKTPDPEIDSTAVYRYDSLQLVMTDSVLNIKWWDLFQDPILDTLITIGLRENKDVLIASTRIEQSRAAVGVAKADYWPKFGYSAGAMRGNVFQGMPTEGGTASNVFTGFGTLSWELDFWANSEE